MPLSRIALRSIWAKIDLMTTSATSVRFDEHTMSVELTDGRTLGVPLAWFPRLLRATPTEREELELSRVGLHWEALDEDISIAGLLAGRGDVTRPAERSDTHQLQPVGWVERSDTHQLPFAKMMGFAKGSTHPTGCHRNFDGQRYGRFYKWRDDAMVPLICPSCQNVFAGKASMPATPPCYFAWGCFRYFSWEREPRRGGLRRSLSSGRALRGPGGLTTRPTGW